MRYDSRALEWHQVVIRNSQLTDGSTLGEFFRNVLTLVIPAITCVVLGSVEGAGDPVRGITQMGCAKIAIQDFLARLRFSEQLDWANFFFFADVDDRTVAQICGELSLRDAIAASSLAARVVDDSEIHVFMPDARIGAFLTERYVDSYGRTGPLSTLEYPE